jgi:hypothetical protein
MPEPPPVRTSATPTTHASRSTNYSRVSTEAKRRALEAAYTDIVTDDLPEWNQDPGLLNWLATL